jgi:signal transduction histidine kinase
MTQRVRAAQDALRGYINTMTTAQEDERRRLARELHDDTIQDLIALGQSAQMIALKLRYLGEDDLFELRDLQNSIQAAIDNVRRLSRGLRPIYLEDLGLITALEMLAKDAEADQGLSVDFTRKGEAQRLDNEVELALYRIAQETLSNVSRHAEAQNVFIATEFTRSQIRLIIADDGAGFQPPDQTSDLAREGHYGLIGMQERAVLIGARLDIHSHPGAGTQITITLPLQDHSE